MILSFGEKQLTAFLAHAGAETKQNASSCQLQTIDEAAFENLKLVVELDLSWNRLQFVPLHQIGRMSLLRKFSMRGNPLNSLTEATFIVAPSSSSSSSSPSSKEFTSDRTVNLATDHESSSSSSASNLSRLYETYPILARSLLLAHKRAAPTDSDKDNDNAAGSFVIEQMDVELLESIVRQHEEISEGNEDGDSDTDGDNYDDGDKLVGAANPDRTVGGSERAADFIAPAPTARANELNQRSKRTSTRGRGRRIRGKSERSPRVGRSNSNSNSNSISNGLGKHFDQLQELDFGRCQLTYIKWSVFDRLDQLKRLHLDGNQLR